MKEKLDLEKTDYDLKAEYADYMILFKTDAESLITEYFHYDMLADKLTKIDTKHAEAVYILPQEFGYFVVLDFGESESYTCYNVQGQEVTVNGPDKAFGATVVDVAVINEICVIILADGTCYATVL